MSWSFILSDLTFRFLIHLEFICVYGIRESFNFMFLHVAVQFSQHHLLKRLLFLRYGLDLCFHRLIDYKCMGLFLGFPPVPLI